MRLLAVSLLALLLASPAAAQETQPLAWSTTHRQLADAISTALVTANLAGATVTAWRSDDRRHAFTCLAIRNGLEVASAEIVKRLVHRTRPDGSDRFSFYSEHTALATVNAGWRVSVSLPIAIGAGYGRAAADKHYLTDIAVGAGAGWLGSRVCR